MAPHLPADMVCYRYHPGAILPVEERVPVPQSKDDEVLVKVLAAGVCHSDDGMFDPHDHIGRTMEKYKFGAFIAGHEGAGVVVSLGASVSITHPYLTVGTYVAIYGPNSCWDPSCLACATGNENICRKNISLGLGTDGSWAEYIAVRAVTLVPVPASPAQIPPAVVAIATDAILTPYHALKTSCGVQPGQSVLCYGTGGLGLHAVAIAKHVFGANVIACDLRDSSLLQAVEMGADHATKPDSLLAYLEQHKLVVDIAIDFVGIQSTFDACFAAIRPGGTIHITGLMAQTLDILPLIVQMKNLTIKTSYWGLKSELVEILQAIADGKLKTLVEERPMSECVQILQDMRAGKVKNRVAMVPGGTLA